LVVKQSTETEAKRQAEENGLTDRKTQEKDEVSSIIVLFNF